MSLVFVLTQLRLLGDDGLPLYDLCRYRDVWGKVTAGMVYLQKVQTSGVRQHSAAATIFRRRTRDVIVISG